MHFFTHFENLDGVITLPGVKIFNRNPQLVEGCGGFRPISQKSAFESVQFLQSIQGIQTYIYSRLRLIEPPREQVILTRLSGEIYYRNICYFEDITVYLSVIC